MIVALRVPCVDGPQHYAKVGVRNAMVISIASACLAIQSGRSRVALGSVGPTVIRCPDAEAYLDAAIVSGQLGDEEIGEFARLVARDARPIDDHRSTAAYRRHAIGVLARRLAQRSIPHVQ
jgi:CO/xanthine dehydrogenase FAD-binding subunit